MKKPMTEIVTQTEVYVGHGQTPFPPGTTLHLDDDHAQQLVADGHAETRASVEEKARAKQAADARQAEQAAQELKDAEAALASAETKVAATKSEAEPEPAAPAPEHAG